MRTGRREGPARGERRAGLEAGPLGTNAKLRATFENPMARRVERFALQSVARDILPDSRTAKCLRIRAHDKDVQVWKSKNHKTASYGGLQTCGSVWTCPVCGAKVVERRRGDTASNGYASRLWRRGASFDPHGSPYPL